jgi:hypothetical protein
MPGRADPRHPVNRFLEACEKACGLAQARQALEVQPPQPEQAKKLWLDLLNSGLDSREQLRQAVTGLYLAQFRDQDVPSMQREVLMGLEGWIQMVSEGDMPEIRAREVTKETERIRESVVRKSL